MKKFLNIISPVLAVIALLLSWQANVFARKANDIAVKQIDAQVVVFDVSPSPGYSFSLDNDAAKDDFSCGLKLRVVNLGGAVTAITGFRVEIEYGDTNIQLTSDGNDTAWDKNAQISDFTDFSVSLDQSLPIQIDSLGDLEILSDISFSYPSDANYDFHPEYVASATPLKARYFFSLSNGVEISSPKGVCYYIESNISK